MFDYHRLLLALSLTVCACGNGASNNDNVIRIQTDGGDASSDVSTEPDAGTDGTSSACGEPTGMRPPPLSEHAGAFVPGDDGSGGTVVIFGGSLGVPENCDFPVRTYETTTWLYDVDCNSWSKLESPTTPPGRARHTAVYDEVGNRVLVFGGIAASGPLADTWALEMTSGEWSEIQTSGGRPPARLNHASAYDPGGRMLIFGGNRGSVTNYDLSNEVWALDLDSGTWTDVSPTTAAPDPRLWVPALWDPERSQMVIFGGGDDSAFTGTVDYFEDVWAWSDRGGTPEWERLDTASTLQPAGRFWAGWTYDSVNGQYMLFGGHDDGNVNAVSIGNRNDTWYFDPANGQWAEHLGGDTYNKDANGFCDFPADFTVIEEESPERRNAHVFVSGPTAAFAMGGKTDCGVIDDLARFDFATKTWDAATRASIGEVCLRKGGGSSCTSLCL